MFSLYLLGELEPNALNKWSYSDRSSYYCNTMSVDINPFNITKGYFFIYIYNNIVQ